MERTPEFETKGKDCESTDPPPPPTYEAVQNHSGDTTYPPAYQHEQEEKDVPSFSQLFYCNIPWLFLLVIEVIVAWYLRSTLYEHWPPSKGSAFAIVSCSYIFTCLCILVGCVTCIWNRILLIAIAESYRKIPCELGCIPGLRRFMTRFSFGMLFTALVPGILIYSFVVIPYQLLWVPITNYETCNAESFPGTIMLRVNTGSQSIEYPPRSNNATISRKSADLTFGLNLLPTINASDVDPNDFELVMSPDITTPDIRVRLRNDYVLIRLAEKTYEWGYTEDKLERKKGNFTEGPEGPSFPSLDMPLRADPGSEWTWSSGKIPSVKWVDDSGKVVLKTAGFRPSIMPCNELRMCTNFSTIDLFLHPKNMEAIMVALARTMIEMVKYGAANC